MGIGNISYENLEQITHDACRRFWPCRFALRAQPTPHNVDHENSEAVQQKKEKLKEKQEVDLETKFKTELEIAKENKKLDINKI